MSEHAYQIYLEHGATDDECVCDSEPDPDCTADTHIHEEDE